MQNFNLFLHDLKKLISFKTTLSEKKEGAPFGEENKKALDYFLSRAKDFGFEVKNYNGYIGEVIFGEGQEIGIIGHLDVVPTGIGWDTDPYKLTLKDDVLYGRGVVDNKSPLLACLYALKELKGSNVKVNKKFRLIAGCNEESGWQDVEYMKSVTSLPEYGFSPDGNFPVSYAEKGMVKLTFKVAKMKNFIEVNGGTAVNAVCDYATAKPLNTPPTMPKNVSFDGEKIICKGKSAHGSTPHLGENAIKILLEYFAFCGEEVQNILDCLFYDKYKIGELQNEQGRVTLSPNVIKEEGDCIKIICDVRIPAPLTHKEVIDRISSFGIEYEYQISQPPFMVDKHGFLIDALSSAYNSVTGENSSPVSLGGSTFARVFEKGCAFGPEFSDYNYSIHDANERLPLSHLKKFYQIYKTAIFNLAQK